MRIFYFASLFFFIFWANEILALSATQVSTNYPEFCQFAASNQSVFKKFRSEEPCRGMVENVTYIQGLEILDIINKNYPYLCQHFKKICTDDLFGEPVAYYFPNLGIICPATLRYVKIAGDINKIFGDLNNLRILEIGGGYGGQCKILHDIWGFASYTLIDLPQCTPLTTKYLLHHQIPQFSCMNNTEIDSSQEYDLIISNYAFSEIDQDEQIYYLEKLINSVPRGYITYNDVSSFHGLISLTIDQVTTALQKPNRKITVIPESPLTGQNNVVIIWIPLESE